MIKDYSQSKLALVSFTHIFLGACFLGWIAQVKPFSGVFGFILVISFLIASAASIAYLGKTNDAK